MRQTDWPLGGDENSKARSPELTHGPSMREWRGVILWLQLGKGIYFPSGAFGARQAAQVTTGKTVVYILDMAGPDALADRLDTQLRQLARARSQELGLRQKDVAARIYKVEQVSAAQLNMVARILSGGSTMLAQNGMRVLQALGLHELDLIWQAWPKKDGDPKPPLPLAPQAALDQRLAWSANQRRFDLGWTQNDVALRVFGPRSGEPVSEKRVAAFLNGHAQIFSKVGLDILYALGLDHFELSWLPMDQLTHDLLSGSQDQRNVPKNSSSRTPRPRVSAEFSRQELQQLANEARTQGITVERLVRNAVLATLKLERRYTTAQLRSIRASANAQGHEWSIEELQAERLPLFWNEAWTLEQLRQGRSIAQIALLAGGWPIRTVGNYLLNVYGISLFKPRLNSGSQQVLRDNISAGASRASAGKELGVSRFVAAYHARGLPTQRDRNFEAKAKAVGQWPATTAEIAEKLFQGSGNRASSWCRDMVKSGRLQQVKRGVYDLAPSRGSGPSIGSSPEWV